MTTSKTKQSLSEKDISDLNKYASDLRMCMCTVTDNISTPRTVRGCNISKDFEDLVRGLTPAKATPTVIENIRATMADMSDIAVAVEIRSDEISKNIKKTKILYHKAKKRVIEPINLR